MKHIVRVGLDLVLIWAVLYSLLPAILSRIAGIGVTRSVKPEQAVALTFDDGPHPAYTPQLLDLLKEYGITTTFFVVGTQAEKYPDLVQRIHREGHMIGIHGYKHQPHWLKMPWTIFREAERTANIIEGLTGTRPHLYRPPWGLLNLMDYFVLRKYKIVLWSSIPGDWRKQNPDRLQNRIFVNMRPGAVIVLHDSDHAPGAESGAPLVMLKSLKRLLESLLREKGDENARCEDKEKSAVLAGNRTDLPTFVPLRDDGVTERLVTVSNTALQRETYSSR